jgi:hypothetical protein
MSTRLTHARRPLPWLAAAAMFIVAGCVDTGPTTTETRSVGTFNAISASAGIEVHVAVGGASLVTVTAGKNVLPHIVTRVEGDRLTIEKDGTTHGKISVEATMPMLTAVDASSSAAVTADGVNGSTVDVNTSSNATVVLAGSATALTLNSSSQSSASLGGLCVRTAVVNVSSQAHAEVRATEAVSGAVSSQAKLTILGSPARVDVSTSSQASVERR